VDINSLAVEITKHCLSMKCPEGKDFSPGLDKNIHCGKGKKVLAHSEGA